MDLHKLVHKNQSIKIVPSIEESLRSTGVDLSLDEHGQLWFNQLKISWKTWKKSPTIEQNIELFFQSRPDAYRMALAMLIKCEDFKDCKPKSLPYTIIETLEKWAKKSEKLPEDHLKNPAFQIAVQQRNQNFFTLIVKTYQLQTIKEQILPVVKEIIDNGNYKQACQIVVAMEFSNEIPVEDLLFPMILQDKSNMIDEYLIECPHQVKPFLLFLDSLLDKSFSIREYVQQYVEEHKINIIKYEKLHYKPLGKLVARLCNKFKIPIETCKNLSKNRTSGGLRYLIYQRYLEHNVSSSVWDDLVKDSLKQNSDSALEFLNMLSEYDKKEAIKWAEYLNIPKDEYPPYLKDVSETECTSEYSEENWDDVPAHTPQECYKLKIPVENIMLVDSAEKFYDMMSSNLINSKVVSLDCEWKPSFGATQSKVALIQIATTDRVYLIDTLVLNSKDHLSFWYTFCKSLLDNPEIIKVGFGLEQDLKEMKVSVTGLSNIKLKGEGLLDMALLWKSLISCGLVLPSSDSAGNGLSTLVESCFGLPLAKGEQCSNWELRPLRITQIEYAALDAYVLLELYNFIERLCHEQGINFEEICNDVMLEGKQKASRKCRIADRIQQSFSGIEVSKTAKELKFLVDPSLSHLMAYLRYCGIDTIVVPTTMLWHDVINLAISEDRFVLVSKIKMSPNKSFPQSSIFDVGVCSVRESLQKIFSYFKIILNKDSLLKNCVYCNEKEFSRLDKEKVLDLKQCQPSECLKENPYYVHQDVNDLDDFCDRFLNDSDPDEDCYLPVATKNNLTVKTSKGVQIDIGDIRILDQENDSFFLLCESCGKLLWKNEELLEKVSSLVQSVTNISLS